MRLRQLFGWLTRRRLDTASATDATAPPEVPETVAQPVAASPELHSPASAAVPVLLSSSPPVIEVTATPSPLGPAVDSTAVFVQESSDTMIVAVPSAPTEIVRAQQAPPPDVTSTTLPSTAPVTAPPAVIAMHAVLVDGDPRTDWRGAGYSRAGLRLIGSWQRRVSSRRSKSCAASSTGSGGRGRRLSRRPLSLLPYHSRRPLRYRSTSCPPSRWSPSTGAGFCRRSTHRSLPRSSSIGSGPAARLMLISAGRRFSTRPIACSKRWSRGRTRRRRSACPPTGCTRRR